MLWGRTGMILHHLDGQGRPLKAKGLHVINKANTAPEGWWLGDSHRYATHFIELQVEALNRSDTSLDMHWTNFHILLILTRKIRLTHLVTSNKIVTSNKMRSRITTFIIKEYTWIKQHRTALKNMIPQEYVLHELCFISPRITIKEANGNLT